jgi:hypothetical protein
MNFKLDFIKEIQINDERQGADPNKKQRNLKDF